MTRRSNWNRLLALEAVEEAKKPIPETPVLFPGEEPPVGYEGLVIRIHVVDGSRNPGEITQDITHYALRNIETSDTQSAIRNSETVN